MYSYGYFTCQVAIDTSITLYASCRTALVAPPYARINPPAPSLIHQNNVQHRLTVSDNPALRIASRIGMPAVPAGS